MHQSDQVPPQAVSKRGSLPRRAKTKAIEALSPCQSPSIIHDFPIPQCIQGINVQVSRSAIPNSGLGLFLMQGNESDGSVLPGTRVATYEGTVYTEPNDIAHVLSDAYRSQYLWGGVNPYTNKYTIVDAAAILSSHGRFINDGLDIEDANVEIVFGTDGKLYVEAISVIPLFSELFLSYGDLYWTDPIMWNTLAYSTQQSVLNYYRCKQPATFASVLPSPCPLQLQANENVGSQGKNMLHITQYHLTSLTQEGAPPQQAETPIPELLRSDVAHTSNPNIHAYLSKPPSAIIPEAQDLKTKQAVHSHFDFNGQPPSSVDYTISQGDNSHSGQMGLSTIEELTALTNSNEVTSSQAAAPHGSAGNSIDMAPAEVVTTHLRPYPNALPRPRKVKATRYVRTQTSPLIPLQEEIRALYGKSPSGQTRITIWHSEQDDKAIEAITSLLKGAPREQAPSLLRQYLLQSLASLRLWRRKDTTHYYDSLPDGACGWYTLAQIQQRAKTGEFLNLQTLTGLQHVVKLLQELLATSPPCNQEGVDNLRYAIDWISTKFPNDGRTLSMNRQMLSCDFSQYCHQVMGALFLQPMRGANHVHSLMSDEEDWAYLYSTPITEHPQTQYTLTELEAIAGIVNQVILSMSHYWILPTNQLDLELKYALHDLAMALWDATNRSPIQNFTLIPMPLQSISRHCEYISASSQDEPQPFNNHEEILSKRLEHLTENESDCSTDDLNWQHRSTHSTESQSLLTQVSSTRVKETQDGGVIDPTRKELKMTAADSPQDRDLTLVENTETVPLSEDTDTIWTDAHKLLLRCYGQELSHQTRISLGRMSSERLQGLVILLQNIERADAPQVFLDHVWDDPSITFNYWRIRDDQLKDIIPGIASEWYTIAYMRWRFHFEATLDFKDPDDCVRGANMLLFLEENLQHDIGTDELSLLQFANSWLRGPTRHEFLSPHKFPAKLLCSIFGPLRVALFSHTDNTSFTADKRMPEDNWTRLLHNSISESKGDSITYREATELASSGNFAQLHKDSYWPTTYFDDELPRCHTSLANLAEKLWDIIHNIQHSQLLSTTRSRMEQSSLRLASNHLQVVNDLIYRSTADTSDQLCLHPNLSGHIRIASLNIDGLGQHKLPIILLYMEQRHIDILCLQDTRLNEKESRLIAHLVRLRYEHINIQVRFSEVRTDTNSTHNKVGGQMIIISGKWASRVTNFYSDFTGLGVVSGLTLQAQDHKILVVSTYWPPRSKSRDNTQLWTKIEKHLSQHQIALSPIDYAKHTIQERFKTHLKGRKDNVAVLVGDLNSTWGTTAAGGCHRGLQEWAQSISLSNPLHSHSLFTSNPVHTHWIGRHTLEGISHEGVSWIDHILLHRNGLPTIVQGGTESSGEWIPISDHRPIWVDIHLQKGGTTSASQYPTNFLPLRSLNRKNLKIVEKYRAVMLQKTDTLSEDISAEDTLKALMKLSVNACPKPGKPTPTFYNCSRFKDGWSPMLVAKLTALSSIVKMRQHITGENKKALWQSKEAISKGIYVVTSEWDKKLRSLSWSDGTSREKAFITGMGPTHWRLFPGTDYHRLPNLLREQERLVKKQLHGRQRSEDRLSMKNASAAREKSVASGKIAQAIKSILCKHQPQYDLNNLKLSDGTIIVDPIQIHDLQTTHWKKWFSSSGQPTFFDLYAIDWSAPQELYETFLQFEAHNAIPLELLQCIWKAITSPTDTHPKLRELLTVSLARPIELEEVKHAIKKAPAGSVPGPSGLSYAMMKEWPEKVVLKFHKALNHIWEQKIIPKEWNIKWLCPKPKVDPDIATLDDLRPLNLLETPRKLLMGIIVHRINRIWEMEEALSNSQYGFRPHRSCENPTLQIINAQEEAEESGTELHGSSWDIRRAFDTVPKSVLIMSWERLGVPQEVAKYIVDLDRECLSVPLTPHAKYLRQTIGLKAFSTHPSTSSNAQGYYGDTGTAQGDTPSPTNWSAAIDILLRALEENDQYPFMVRTDDNIITSQAKVFADDIFTISARKEGLQEKANVVSAAAAVLGFQLAIPKLRTTAKSWGQEPSGYENTDYTLVVHDSKWQPTYVNVVHADNTDQDVAFRYLGVHLDINNKYNQQFHLLHDTARQAATVSYHKQASPETIYMAVRMATHRKIAYAGKFNPWSISKLRQLDIPFNRLYKHHLRSMKSHPNATLYTSPDVGGIGLRRLSDQINLDKWAMLTRGLYSDRETVVATNSLLLRSLRISQTDTDIGHAATTKPAEVSHMLRSLVEAMAPAGYCLRKSGISPQLTPSQLLTDLLPDIDHRLRSKLMHLRITTMSDVMVFNWEGGNTWDDNLLRELELPPEVFPVICPIGERRLRVGQFWATSNYGGPAGEIVEIMGLQNRRFNGRRWREAIISHGWVRPTPSPIKWMTPCILSDSRGAGATEWFDIAPFFTGEIWQYLLSEEVPRYTNINDIDIPCVARAVRFRRRERGPLLTANPKEPMVEIQMTTVKGWATQLYNHKGIEIYTDGSLRYFDNVSSALLQLPHSTRKPAFIQGGLLLHFEENSLLDQDSDNITVSVEGGIDIHLTLPSSIELYSIVLAILILDQCKMRGTIYTDFIDAVHLSNTPTLIRNMGRKANFPLYETISRLLQKNNQIRLVHVKAHGPLHKQESWSRAQWGNYYADRIAKGYTDTHATRHISWPISSLEVLVMEQSPWHWISEDNHLLLEPLHSIFMRMEHQQYITSRDTFRIDRGQELKWSGAHYGFLSDVWKLPSLSLSKRASVNRLIYDKGWHGGNRAKAKCPSDKEREEWIGCGDCGYPDSQNHWIRECNHAKASAIRNQTLFQADIQVQDILKQKGRYQETREIFNLCSEILHFAENLPGGEQTWLGIIPKPLLDSITPRLPIRDLNIGSTIPNRWRKAVVQLLRTLAEGAQALWKRKEESRRDLLSTIRKEQAETNRIMKSSRSRNRKQDIRILFRRIAYQQSKSKVLPLDIDNSPLDQLLQDNSIPASTSPRRRLIKVSNKPHPYKQLRLKWDLSLDQEYFKLTRDHSRTIQAKKGIKYRRNLRHGTYDSNLNLEWLQHITEDGVVGLQGAGPKRHRIDSASLDKDSVEVECRMGIG